MKKEKAFDCVRMKWDIQRKQQVELGHLPEAEQKRILDQRVADDPILGPFLKRVPPARIGSTARSS